MTERNITIPSDSTPDELLSTVQANAFLPLRMALIDLWNRFSVSEAFIDYLQSETSNPAPLLSDLAKTLPNPDKEYKELLYLHNTMRQGNQSKAFMKYLSEDVKYACPFFEIGIDGKSALCTVFLTFCAKEFSKDELKIYLKIKALLEKKNYSDFMKSFNKLMTSSNKFEDWNLENSERKALNKSHDDHWDSKTGKPKVLPITTKKVEQSKPTKKMDSNSGEASNEKEGKTEKAKSTIASGSNSDRQKEEKLTKKKRSNALGTAKQGGAPTPHD